MKNKNQKKLIIKDEEMLANYNYLNNDFQLESEKYGLYEILEDLNHRVGSIYHNSIKPEIITNDSKLKEKIKKELSEIRETYGDIVDSTAKTIQLVVDAGNLLSEFHKKYEDNIEYL